MFFDTHSHIHLQKEFPDVQDVIVRAEKAGVEKQMIVGCAVKDSRRIPEFLERHSDHQLWGAVGVHPHDSNQLTEDIVREFETMVNAEEKLVAIGEIGLDYFRNLQPKDVQHKAFTKQLHLAKSLSVPAIVHVRDAWNDALRLLHESGAEKVILHCFSGDATHARQAWEKGYYTAFGGVLTYPKNQELRDIAAEAPDELLLIETDCPYLSPQPHRGKRNEPAYVVDTAKELARVRGLSLEAVGKLTTDNALRIFGLPS